MGSSPENTSEITTEVSLSDVVKDFTDYQASGDIKIFSEDKTSYMDISIISNEHELSIE
jgi:hypothetical protein